ncbi:hypothetical protein B0J15DRAFT_491311 [Fusarium solani]|uniref:Zn(2)-C6 fungal-type domain-containing protein n=1 Tax=Fusarium solani TaxID=169388 RepID=A0A9P9KFS2_FUSSL|nr:uncharacterized protein B0J15DRAFT_491311 [Fusarium solani]KAH7259873.1 hypothetical protein B0J15DRAFT_491311 [Fusarium solani]
MKRGGCCNACRRRHRKCVVQPGASQCGACAESGRECRFENDIQFKHSYTREHREVAEQSRTWTRVPSTISFVTPQGIDGELSESPNTFVDPVRSNSPTSGNSLRSPLNSGTSIPEDASRNQDNQSSSGKGGLAQGHGSDDPRHIASPQSYAENSDFGAPLTSHGEGIASPYEAPSSGSTRLLPLQQPLNHPVSSIPYILGDSPPSQLPPPETPSSAHSSGVQSINPEDTYGFTERQAFLFITYIHKLAPSSDACDDARHFTLEVPRLAFQEPMIMNGLLALASRYDARCSNSESDLEGTYYHNRCIELLIEAFARPPETWDSKLLTAVVIARLYEEYDNESDSDYHHLSGTRNLLNHEAVARFVTQGGLAEAASWVHLRQTIYVYLVRREPVEICLENFERSTVFRRTDDSAYANRAVYLFAKMMKLLFPLNDSEKQAVGVSPGPWELVEMEVNQWYEMKPVSFKPIYYKPADLKEDRPFPVVCIAASVPVVAMQYYYAAKAIICLHKCNTVNPNIGYHAARLRHDWEQRIASYLCTLMGLALSNEHVLNAFYLPAHMLSLCGYCIRQPCERAHTVQYLQKVDEVIKWKTRRLIQTLEKEWEEMDNFEKR